MKKHIKVISITLLAVLVFAFLFWWGGNSPSLHGFTEKEEEVVMPAPAREPEEEKEPEPIVASPPATEEEKTPTPEPIRKKVEEDLNPSPKEEVLEPSPKEKVLEPSPKEEVLQPSPKEEVLEPSPKEEVLEPIEKKEDTCFISVRCDTILNNKEYIKSEIAEIIPQSGVIIENCEVVFNEGESVFDVILRETKNKGVHFEFVKTPGYNSAYIEGIANIYEFDCGELSGWMYKVNGSFPEVGCSEYILKNGDKVELVYTCDSGKDVGSSRPIR